MEQLSDLMQGALNSPFIPAKYVLPSHFQQYLAGVFCTSGIIPMQPLEILKYK